MMTELEYECEDSGGGYEDVYNNWLKLLQKVAVAPNDFYLVNSFPHPWLPLLYYLGANTSAIVPHGVLAGFKRHEVEFFAATQPVLVDALWRADMDPEWAGDRRHETEKRFPIATYSGFWRPEIMDFIRLVEKEHKQTSDKCVFVPCSANKPYPSKLHKAVKEICKDFEIVVVSSAVGVAPESFWDRMPLYDAGLPFFDRVRSRVFEFLLHTNYRAVLNYTDMMYWDVEEGLKNADEDGSRNRSVHLFARSFFGDDGERPNYMPLHTDEYLSHLARAVKYLA